MRKKNDLKISPFLESSRGGTWRSCHCRISAGLTVSLMSARLRNCRPADMGQTTALPSEHCCALPLPPLSHPIPRETPKDHTTLPVSQTTKLKPERQVSS